MSKVNILVTGAAGQVGQSLQALAPDFPGFVFHFTDTRELDICNESAIEQLFAVHSFKWCINCAAYTAVDKAESESEKARRVNVEGPRHLARACRQHGARLVHLSTDYVYHNAQNRPMSEADPTHPQSVYARTKLAGEDAASAVHPEATLIVRTSWVYSEFGHNFFKTMLRLGRERESLNVVCDQIGTPTYAHDLALALLRMAEKAEKGAIRADALRGIYHFSNEGVASWYDFALAIFEYSGMPCRVYPIETASYPTPAKRPPYSVLSKTKWKRTFGHTIPHWTESLRHCVEKIARS